MQPLSPHDPRLLVAQVDAVRANLLTEEQLADLWGACERAGEVDPYGCKGWGTKPISGMPGAKYVQNSTLGMGWCHKTRGTGMGEGGERMERYGWALWHPELEAPLWEFVLGPLTAIFRAVLPELFERQQARWAAGPLAAAAMGAVFGGAMARWRDEVDRPHGVDAAGTTEHVDEHDDKEALAAILTLHKGGDGAPALPALLHLPDHRVDIPCPHGTVTFLPARLVKHAVTGAVEGRRVALVAYLSEYMTGTAPHEVDWWHHGEVEGVGPCPCGCAARGRRQDAPATCPCGCGRVLQGG